MSLKYEPSSEPLQVGGPGAARWRASTPNTKPQIQPPKHKLQIQEGSYLRLMDCVYHSTLGLRVMKKKKELQIPDPKPQRRNLNAQRRMQVGEPGAADTLDGSIEFAARPRQPLELDEALAVRRAPPRLVAGARPGRRYPSIHCEAHRLSHHSA